MKPRTIILLVAIMGIMVAMMVSLTGNLSTYSDFAYAKKKGKQVHVVCEWVDRDKAEENANHFAFFAKDTLNQIELVHYYDPKPNNFEQAEKVVLIGGYKEEGFVAEKIITKCPSKYEEEEIAIE